MALYRYLHNYPRRNEACSINAFAFLTLPAQTDVQFNAMMQ